MKSLLRGIPWKKIWPYDPSPGPSEIPFCFLTTWLSTGIPQILLQWLLKARRIHSSRIPHMPFLQLKYLLMLLSSPSAAAKVVSFLCYFWRDQTCSRKRSSLNLLHSSSVVWPALLLQFLFKWCHMKEDFLNLKVVPLIPPPPYLDPNSWIMLTFLSGYIYFPGCSFSRHAT